MGQCLQSTFQPCLSQSECSMHVPILTAPHPGLTFQGSPRQGWTGDALGTHKEGANGSPYCQFREAKAAV